MNMQTRINERSADFAAPTDAPAIVRTGLADGAIALAWVVDNAIGKGLRCSVLAPNGRDRRTDFVMEAGDIDLARQPRLTALEDGGFRVSWVENGAKGARIESEEFHPRAI